MRSDFFEDSAITRSSSAISTAFFWSMFKTSRVLEEAMRSVSSASSTPMRWRSIASRRSSSAASSNLPTSDLEAPRLLLGLDAFGRDGLLLGDPGGFDRLAGLNVRGLDASIARDLAGANFLVRGDPG